MELNIPSTVLLKQKYLSIFSQISFFLPIGRRPHTFMSFTHLSSSHIRQPPLPFPFMIFPHLSSSHTCCPPLPFTQTDGLTACTSKSLHTNGTTTAPLIFLDTFLTVAPPSLHPPPPHFFSGQSVDGSRSLISLASVVILSFSS